MGIIIANANNPHIPSTPTKKKVSLTIILFSFTILQDFKIFSSETYIAPYENSEMMTKIIEIIYIVGENSLLVELNTKFDNPTTATPAIVNAIPIS